MGKKIHNNPVGNYIAFGVYYLVIIYYETNTGNSVRQTSFNIETTTDSISEHCI